ncbi:MAG: RdgB/HAM1 family non-canonical purine NTP pyrophosphatase [Myxococcales bacterium]|nr:RdgB/HAM1 family non-canonical purine NTP pyrophosphatase [Myxococcales bacterium]
MKLCLASRNAGKRREAEEILGPLGYALLTLEEAGVGSEVEFPEEGDTFEENAVSKARALQALVGGWCLADDSGLAVDALGGAPGVRSARYAASMDRAEARDRANTQKLLRELSCVASPHRTARFVCVVALVGPSDQCLLARGECLGEIIDAPRGHNGFGYDPVFVPAGYTQTMAELSSDEKNRISHRGQALRALARELRRRKIMASDAGE